MLARRDGMNSRTSLNVLSVSLVFLSGCWSATEQARFDLFIFALLSTMAFSLQAVASGPALFVKTVSGWRAVVALVGAMTALLTAGVLFAAAADAMLGYSPGIRSDSEVKRYFVAILAMGLFQVVLPARLIEIMSSQRPTPEFAEELGVRLMRPIRVVAIPAGVAYVGFAIWLMVRLFG